MNAGQTAVTVSLIIYTFGYVVSLYAVSFWFSKGLMPEKLRNLSSTPSVFNTVLLTTFFVPLTAFLSFYWSKEAILPAGMNLSDYALHFSTGAHIIWFLILKPMVIGFLVGLITPETMGFSHRNKAILAFIMHNLGSYSMIQLMKWVIGIALS
jgi:hypothetical protein